MPSQIKVDQIAGATGSTVTLPSGQTLDLSSGTVTLPSAGITADKLNLISTASVPSVTAKGTPSVSDGYIQLNCEQNSHGIKIKSPPHSAGANYTMVMPNSLGTASQVLRMNSGATALEFATPAVATSDFVKLSSTNITSSVASVDIDGFFDDTIYGGYVVYGNGIELSSGSHIVLRVRQSNTVLSGANYSYVSNYSYWSSSTNGNSLGINRAATSIRMFDWSRYNTSSIANFHFHFSRPTVAGLTKNFHGNYYSNGESSATYWSSPNNFGGEYEGNTNALSGITLLPQAGNMTAGSIVMYGVKK